MSINPHKSDYQSKPIQIQIPCQPIKEHLIIYSKMEKCMKIAFVIDTRVRFNNLSKSC